MRRFIKPAIAIAAAGAAAFIVGTAGSPFDGAPAAKTKTIECKTTTSGNIESVKPKTFGLVLPTIPKAQLPCDLPQTIADRLSQVTLPTVTLPTVGLPNVPLPEIPPITIVIPPIPAIGFPGFPPDQGCDTSIETIAC
jgi:hypothetical protein